MRLAKMITNLFGAAAVAATLAACGGSAGDDSRSEHQRDREKLEGRYSRLRGTYVGAIQPGAGEPPTNVELAMYVDYRDGGVDSQGNPKFLPLLLASFILPDFVGENDRESLKADYDEITGRVIFTRSGSDGASGRATAMGAFSISGVVRGETIEGELVRNGGVWGKITLNRVNETAAGPTGGEDEAERRRRVKIFESVRGVYRGEVETNGINHAAQLNLTLTQRPGIGPSGKAMQLPVLVARYLRLDVRDTTLLNWYMSDVTYNSRTKLITMTSDAGDASRSGATAPGAGVMSGEGTITAEGAEIQLVDHRGPVGRFRGEKLSQ